MSLDPKKNFAVCTAANGYDAIATTIVLSTGDGAKLPAPATDGAFNLVWYDRTTYGSPSADPLVEIVRVTARTGDTLTVQRAQEGTSASAKNTAGKSYSLILSVTAKDFSDIEEQLTVTGASVYTDTGSQNAAVITTPLGLTSLSDGMTFRVRFAYPNTSSTPTLTVDSCAAKQIASAPGESLINGSTYQSYNTTSLYDLSYDSVNDVFFIMSPTIRTVFQLKNLGLWFANDNSSAANTVVLTSLSGGYSASSTGTTAVFVPTYTNTGATTINIDGAGAVALKDPSGLDLLPGVLQAGSPTIIVYDSTFWRIVAGGARHNCIRYGELYIQANTTATAIGVSGTYYNAAGTWTAGISQTEPNGVATFTKSTTGGIDSLLYNGPSGRTFRVSASVCMESSSSNQDLAAAIGINGTRETKTGIHFRFAVASTDHVTATCSGIVNLSNGDKITLMVTNESSTGSVTVDYSNLTLTEV